MTPLDIAYVDMDAARENDALRLGFYGRLVDCELFLLLEEEPVNDVAKPMIFPVEDQKYALVFDSEERLAEFAQKPSPYIALSGRVIISMLQGQGVGMGVNLSVAPSSTLLPLDVLVWLADTLHTEAEQTHEMPVAVYAPTSIPKALITSLDAKLALMPGIVKTVYLAEVTYNNGIREHVIAFIDAVEQAQIAITSAVSEALVFSGVEAGTLDVLYLKSSDPICIHFAKVALRFDLPDPVKPKFRTLEAPGSNPAKPPKLR